MPYPIIRSRGIRISATGLSPPPGSLVRARRIAPPSPAVQRADHRRALEEPAREQQRLGRRDVEPGEQHAVAVLAALGDDLGEEVELGERVLEAQPEHPEPALLLRRRRGRPRAAQPAQEGRRPPAHVAPAGDQVLLDPRQRGRGQRRRREVGLLEHERLDRREPRQQRAGLLLQEPGRGRVGRSSARMPPARRDQRPLGRSVAELVVVLVAATAAAVAAVAAVAAAPP